jgi:hypothetical protein
MNGVLNPVGAKHTAHSACKDPCGIQVRQVIGKPGIMGGKPRLLGNSIKAYSSRAYLWLIRMILFTQRGRYFSRQNTLGRACMGGSRRRNGSFWVLCFSFVGTKHPRSMQKIDPAVTNYAAPITPAHRPQAPVSRYRTRPTQGILTRVVTGVTNPSPP